ncbi:hypothetical protein DFH27DRAFT_575413 [Peziza echinospora]|nr:hypothetical protein DFH27DRAFT_575413 [Peziza echinospora]
MLQQPRSGPKARIAWFVFLWHGMGCNFVFPRCSGNDAKSLFLVHGESPVCSAPPPVSETLASAEQPSSTNPIMKTTLG